MTLIMYAILNVINNVMDVELNMDVKLNKFYCLKLYKPTPFFFLSSTHQQPKTMWQC